MTTKYPLITANVFLDVEGSWRLNRLVLFLAFPSLFCRSLSLLLHGTSASIAFSFTPRPPSYRYKIYAEGNAWSVSSKYGFACGSTMLIIEPYFEAFYSRGMVYGENCLFVQRRPLCEALKEQVSGSVRQPRLVCNKFQWLVRYPGGCSGRYKPETERGLGASTSNRFESAASNWGRCGKQHMSW
jgi:hypothetical protein